MRNCSHVLFGHVGRHLCKHSRTELYKQEHLKTFQQIFVSNPHLLTSCQLLSLLKIDLCIFLTLVYFQNSSSEFPKGLEVG